LILLVDVNKASTSTAQKMEQEQQGNITKSVRYKSTHQMAAHI